MYGFFLLVVTLASFQSEDECIWGYCSEMVYLHYVLFVVTKVSCEIFGEKTTFLDTVICRGPLHINSAWLCNKNKPQQYFYVMIHVSCFSLKQYKSKTKIWTRMHCQMSGSKYFLWNNGFCQPQYNVSQTELNHKHPVSLGFQTLNGTCNSH